MDNDLRKELSEIIKKYGFTRDEQYSGEYEEFENIDAVLDAIAKKIRAQTIQDCIEEIIKLEDKINMAPLIGKQHEGYFNSEKDLYVKAIRGLKP